LRALAEEEGRLDAIPRIRLFGEVAGLDGVDVPDPWGGSTADFDRVLTMLETGMTHIVSQLGPACLPGTRRR
jgi:protein-tyrosine-phosphatase